MLDAQIVMTVKGYLLELAEYLGLGHMGTTALITFVATFIVLNFILITVLFLIWLERKVAGHMQHRPGPMYVGWHGLLVSLADGIKLLQKEDLMPKSADRILFRIAPYLVFLGMFLAFAVVPFSKHLAVVDLPIALLYIFAVSTLTSMGILIAGWSSNSKYPAFGAMRAVAQNISYEIPMVLSTIGVMMIAQSLSLQQIVEAQATSVWFIVLQPIAFLIFFIAALAEVNRPPFDLPEGESELVAGYHSEYSGMRFSMFTLVEFAGTFLMSAIAATLFLGGWSGPAFLPGIAWFFIKTYALVFLMMWVRWTVPRFRIDQVMDIGWKVLIPVSLANIIITAAVILVV